MSNSKTNKQIVRSRLIAGKNYLFYFLACMLTFTLAQAQQQEPHQPPLPPQQQTAAQFPEASAYANANLTYNIIDAPNNTFCYDVYAEGRLMIHQSSAPGLPGNEGFKTREDATKVVEMVMYKIRKGEMPPTVSIDEMKELGVIK